MENARLRDSHRLSLLVAGLMAIQASTGMALPRLYRDDAFALEAWRLNDPFTLLVALPVLLVALMRARKGSLQATLVWLGVLQFSLYNYAFYLFGAELNAFFLLYVALFALSAFALVFGLAGLDIRRLEAAMSPRTPARLVTGYLVSWALILSAAWVAQWAAFVFAGQALGLGEGPFRLIAALDLSFVVAPLVLTSLWLWRRRAWGVALAVILLVKGVLYSALLSAASLPLFDGEWGGDPLLALWLVLLAGAAASLVILLTNVQKNAIAD